MVFTPVARCGLAEKAKLQENPGALLQRQQMMPAPAVPFGYSRKKSLKKKCYSFPNNTFENQLFRNFISN